MTYDYERLSSRKSVGHSTWTQYFKSYEVIHFVWDKGWFQTQVLKILS